MIRYRPCFSLLVFSGLFGLFSACSPDKSTDAQKTFGEVDKTVIAADTTMQTNMDLSYEYQKTIKLNDTTLFDFLAYDRPSRDKPKEWEGKLIIIRRTNSRQDTVVKDNRLGNVKGLSIADLDQDGRPEILFYEDQTVDKNNWHLRIYSQKADGTFKGIYWRELDAKTANDHYRGQDTFFIYQNHLIRRYPYYEPNNIATTTQANLWQSYKLSHDLLVLENEKIER